MNVPRNSSQNDDGAWSCFHLRTAITIKKREELTPSMRIAAFVYTVCMTVSLNEILGISQVGILVSAFVPLRTR